MHKHLADIKIIQCSHTLQVTPPTPVNLMSEDGKLTVPNLWAKESEIPTHTSKDLAQYGNTCIIELSQKCNDFFLH